MGRIGFVQRALLLLFSVGSLAAAEDTEPSLKIFQAETLWILIVGFIVAFILAFGIGANDVANAFGTAVGSKVLTLRQACYIATVFEMLGCCLVGYKVSDTIRKGIVDIGIYHDAEKELMLGSLAALAGSAIWLLAATFFRLPISGTHSIVGATLGFTFVNRGTEGINWTTIGTIVASWFVSPVLSGIISALIFVFIRHFILNKPKPLEPGLKALPIFYFITLFINVFSIVLDGPSLLYMDVIPWWGAAIISTVIAAIAGMIVQFYIVPRQRQEIHADFERMKERNPKVNFTFGDSAGTSANTTPNNSRAISLEDLPRESALTLNGTVVKENGAAKVTPQTKLGVLGVPSSPTSESLALPHNSSQVPLVSDGMKNSEIYISLPADGNDLKPDGDNDKPETAKLFSFLQILTASFGSFAHGGNDVSNAIGPLIALWLIYYRGNVHQKDDTPWYILVYGGIGISIGLWVWGRRVIKTLGEDLSKITPSSGFTIEIGAAFTVLFASKIGIPISTTHCKVGSVVFVGWVRSRQGVDWRLFRNIIFAWIITLPVAGGLSALLMFIFQKAAL